MDRNSSKRPRSPDDGGGNTADATLQLSRQKRKTDSEVNDDVCLTQLFL
jgi:hypothetical protein